MGKLKGKVAVITAATSGMALATAKLFVEEGAYVFITGRRKEKLDEAVKLIGKNVTGVQGDAANLADLDRLYETVKREKGKIDVLFASAGLGEFAALKQVTEEHFDRTFDLNVRGTLFTVQKALPLFSDNGSIFLNGSIAGIKGFPSLGVSKAALRSFARTWLSNLKFLAKLFCPIFMALENSALIRDQAVGDLPAGENDAALARTTIH
jgi:NAD(P)-dependent dehydrogenase (short-subunit alcohol dehydrogenase family)